MNFDPDSISQEKLHEYRRAAEAAWGDDTRHESYIGHPQPSAGQCYVTSRWLTTHLGGHVGSKAGHYFWVSPDRSHVIDLTGDQFAYKPADLRFNGIALDEEDEPWEFSPEQMTHRPGPVMFKRADHPLYKGLRVKDYKTENPRVQTFAERANAALEGRLARTADFGWGGDAYPGQEPQVADRIEHDRPGGEDEHYKWVYANGRLELDPISDYSDLANLLGVSGGDSKPVALGTLEVSGGRANWKVQGNLGLAGIARVLHHHTRQAGWEWGGLASLGGQRLAYSMWMHWHEETGHLLMSHDKRAFPDYFPGRTAKVAVFGATATVDEDFYKYAAEGLDEWAEDHKLALNTLNKPHEDIDGYDTYGPRPEYAQGPTDISSPTGTLRCPECGRLFPSFGLYVLHRKEEEPQGDDLDQDGHFPEMDQDKAIPPHFHEREPFVFPLAHTASLLDEHDEKLWHLSSAATMHLGAYLDGDQVGVLTVQNDGRVLDATIIKAPERTFQALVRAAGRRFDELSYGGEDKAIQLRLRRMGFVYVDQDTLTVKWAKGKEPMDMIKDPIPFIFDIDKDVIHVGQPGANTHSLMGDFKVGGILEGVYEPGGVVTITNQTDYPWTVRHLVDLWYWSYPSMRVTDVQYKDPMGNIQKLTSQSSLEAFRQETLTTLHREASTLRHEIEEHIGMPLQGLYVHGSITDPRRFTEASDIDLAAVVNMPEYPDGPIPIDIGPLDLGYEFGAIDLVLFNRKAPTDGVRVANTKTAANVGPYVRQLAATDPAVWTAYQALEDAGAEVYAVGGVVRDALMGEESNDIDLMATGLHQDDVDRVLRKLPGKVDITGKSFGVFRYNYKGHEVEIALPRTEKSTGKRRVDFDVNVDHTLPVEDDLQRRDFTINSPAINLKDGRLVDPFDAVGDIKSRTLRTTHPNSFVEDPTRILRALVMHGRYGVVPDERTRAEMEKYAPSIHDESWDNMRGIWDKLLKSKNPAAAIRLAQETGVLKHVLPELDSNWDYDQRNPHHNFTLGTHHMHVLEGVQDQSTDPDLRFAALLHDIGKPASRAMKCLECNNVWHEDDPLTSRQNGNKFACSNCGSTDTKGTFHGGDGVGHDHAIMGATMAEPRLDYMKWPKARTKRIVDLITHHMFPAFSSAKGARKFLNRVGDHADDLFTLRHADMYGKGTNEFQDTKTPVDDMRRLVDQARSTAAPTDRSMLAINGRDLIEAGVPKGPEMAQTLNQLMEAVLENPSINTREGLLALVHQSLNPPVQTF
jgi:tRNA nucleotidyltransferase (CCA-adding enzyme)